MIVGKHGNKLKKNKNAKNNSSIIHGLHGLYHPIILLKTILMYLFLLRTNEKKKKKKKWDINQDISDEKIREVISF